MGAEYLARVFDRAKVLFGSRHDLTHIGDEPGAIGTISAMEFLNEIEVFELLPIQHDIVGTSNLGNFVNRETGRLIEADEQIENEQRDDHAVDDWPGNQILRTVGNQPAKKSSFELAVRLFHGLFEFDALALDLEEHAGLLFLQRRSQIIFESGYLGNYVANSIIHEIDNSCKLVMANEPKKSAWADLFSLPHHLVFAGVLFSWAQIVRRYALGCGYQQAQPAVVARRKPFSALRFSVHGNAGN